MNETFRNVSIFIIFVMSLFVWNFVQDLLIPYFKFDYGRSVLMVVGATGVLVIFHLLYYYLSKAPEKIVYLTTLFVVILIGCLLHYHKLPAY